MLEADYLIIGAGAMGMAFADVILHESDASLIIVDRYHKPGGHWNVAYPFVRLHQPSSFYGVSSSELNNGKKDEVGLNKGLNSLASGAEVSAYFDDVMRYQFLPSGRVQYFPMCEYEGNNSFRSLLTGKQYSAKVKKVVDSTYLKTSVPATHTPNFSVAEGVQFIPINELPKIRTAPEGFVVIGGGKTGIDACLWLLENQVDPDKITWIISRDGWLTDRATAQPTLDFFETTIGNQVAQFEAVAESSSIEDLFVKLEEKGVLIRIDTTVKPKMFHGATISKLELEAMRSIKKVVRLGHVSHIGLNEIQLKEGSISTSPNQVHIDCSATAVGNAASSTIFQGDLIIPQTIRAYQPVFSAAVIAYIDLNYETDEQKNQLCQVVPLPDKATDWIEMTAVNMLNQYAWNQDKSLRKWMAGNRLNGFAKMLRSVSKEDTEKIELMQRMRNSIMPAMMKLQGYIAQLK